MTGKEVYSETSLIFAYRFSIIEFSLFTSTFKYKAVNYPFFFFHAIFRYVTTFTIPINKSKNINKTVVQGFHESCSCFIYGNYLATIAMARSVLEFSLRDKFKEFCNRTLDEIINKIWNSVPALKNKDNYRDKANFIRMKGNDVLHKDDIKPPHLIYEPVALFVLSNLKELIKFIYK